MGHGDPAKATPSKPADPTMDHSGMEMPTSDQPAMDHSGMEMPTSGQPAMDHSAMGHEMPAATDAPRTPIPPLTDADRQAAFPPVDGHAAHDRKSHSYWLVDHLEAWDADTGTGLGWEGLAWVGGDLHRVWLRSEGEAVDGDIESADLEVLAGRSVSPWWDLVAGVRHDFGEGPSQTFVGVGVMGLSPYKFEVAATGYLGQNGQTAARLEGEYDTLLTNRLILQWRAEANLYGKDDAERGIGSGLGTVEAGVRLRFEVTRKFAPYVGVVWERAYGGTADLRRAADEDIHDTRVVAGIRFWF
jgi:copper resistance protein B